MVSPSKHNKAQLTHEELLLCVLYILLPRTLSHRDIGDPHKTYHLRMEGHVTLAIELYEDQLLWQRVQFLLPATWFTPVFYSNFRASDITSGLHGHQTSTWFMNIYVVKTLRHIQIR